MRKFLISAILVLNFVCVYSQTYPKYIKPGKTYEVVATDDTMWVLTDAMVRKILKVDMENDILNEQVTTLNQEVEIYKLQSEKKDSLILILEEDRDYYQKIWQECSSDIETLGKISKRRGAATKIAIASGIVTTVTAFFLGGYLLSF